MPIGTNPPAITSKTCVLGTMTPKTLAPIRVLSRVNASTTVLPLTSMAITVPSMSDCHSGIYPPINDTGGNTTTHTNSTRVRGYLEAHTSTSLAPGAPLETVVIPLCKCSPGHILSARVMTRTIASLPTARSYYPPITGVGVNANVPPGTIITTTVTLIGAKTPNRSPITH